jgi:tetratricopeptide (TPR) repeat protein
MFNLANSYAALKRHDEAIKLYEDALAAQKRVLAPDHPDTLASMHNLANSYAALNRHAEALKLREETLAARRRVLPPDHPDTLGTMTGLARCYSALKRHAEAAKLYEEILAARKRVLPKDHRDTLASMNNLASSYAALNRHAEALELREETLAIRKRVLPKDHPDTLISIGALADSLFQLDRGVEALPLLDEFVAKAPTSPTVNPRLIPRVFRFRAKHFQKLGDPAGCRATAEMWENLSRTDADSLFNAACFRAVTAAVQANISEADTAQLAKVEADKAMAWLTKAVAAGYKDAAHIRKDANLDFLRDREDFKKLLASLEAKSPPNKDHAPSRDKK